MRLLEVGKKISIGRKAVATVLVLVFNLKIKFSVVEIRGLLLVCFLNGLFPQ